MVVQIQLALRGVVDVQRWSMGLYRDILRAPTSGALVQTFRSEEMLRRVRRVMGVGV